MFGFFKKASGKTSDTGKDDRIVALADGTMFPIEEVKDAVFSQKMLGDGVAFRYEGEKVTLCAPADGILSALFPTGHAFGVTMANGVELLIHVGIDTVSANGDGFTLLGAKQGDRVKAEDPIVEVDLKKLQERFDLSTMLILSNDNGKSIRFMEPGEVKKGQEVCTIS